MQEVLVIWIKDQNGHHVPLNQGPILSKVLTLSILWRQRGEEAIEEKFQDLGKEVVSITKKQKHNKKNLKGEEARNPVKAATSYPEDLAEIINEEGSALEIRFSM